VTIYGTGLGPYTRSVPDGGLAELPLNPLIYPVQALFVNSPTCMFGFVICYPGPAGTVPGEVLFAGASPLIVNGVTVLNVRIPGGAYPGPYAGGLVLYPSPGGVSDYSRNASVQVAIK
jgi:hypothetical protein